MKLKVGWVTFFGSILNTMKKFQVWLLSLKIYLNQISRNLQSNFPNFFPQISHSVSPPFPPCTGRATRKASRVTNRRRRRCSSRERPSPPTRGRTGFKVRSARFSSQQAGPGAKSSLWLVGGGCLFCLLFLTSEVKTGRRWAQQAVEIEFGWGVFLLGKMKLAFAKDNLRNVIYGRFVLPAILK